MRILFLTQTTELGPSSRLRVYQYLPFLKKAGIQFQVRPAIPTQYYHLFRSSTLMGKASYFKNVIVNRTKDFFQIKNYNLVFLQKEVLPGIYPIFEEIIIEVFKKKLIFDFDDAIYLTPPNRKGMMSRFRYKDSVSKILKKAAWVIVGNNFLKDYAQRFTKKITVLPTPVDLERYRPNPLKRNSKEKIVIGWIGSLSASLYLEDLRDVLAFLAEKYNLSLHLIGAGDIRLNRVKYISKTWDLETEVSDLSQFDIGLAPLRNDGWSQGKCGYKLLQYMAMGIPAVASRVGVHKEIIEDGINGFLVNSPEEWIEKLSLLIEDKTLRQAMGMKGRQTVEKKFSLEIFSQRLKIILEEVYEREIK